MEYHEDRDKVVQRSHWYMERNLQKQGEQMKYIVCFTVKMKKENLLPEEYEFHSDWQAYETLQEAEAVYTNLISRVDLYTASICKTVHSTDYILKESK